MEKTARAAHSDVELAVLDAPILARGMLTSFLLHLAEAGAFDPVWSDQIHATWARALQASRPVIPVERIRHRRVEMDRAFPVASVIASRDAQDEVLAHCATAEERKNAHVLATALSARAAVIVTDAAFGLTGVMTRLWHDIAVLSADAWCLELLDRHPETVLHGARAHRASLSRGDGSIDGWLTLLREPRTGLPLTAEVLSGQRDRL